MMDANTAHEVLNLKAANSIDDFMLYNYETPGSASKGVKDTRYEVWRKGIV